MSSSRLHGGQEAEVSHVVGFVDHADLDVAEIDSERWPIEILEPDPGIGQQ